MAGFVPLPVSADTPASAWAWRGALALAVAGHAIFWVALHHRGQPTGDTSREHAMKVRVATRAAPQVVPPVVPQPAPAPQPAPPAPPVTSAPAPTPAPAAQVSRPQPVARPAPVAAVPAPAAPAAASAPAISPEVEKAILAMVPESYLPIEELDVTPELLGGWRINRDAIPKGPSAPQKLKVTLRLWVSDAGHIDAFQVLTVEPMVSWYEDLLKTIDTSTLRPALKNGSPVGASWEIELELDMTNEL